MNSVVKLNIKIQIVNAPQQAGLYFIKKQGDTIYKPYL